MSFENLQSYSALLIDENQHFAKITRRFLIQAGIGPVVHAVSPDEALGLLQHMTVSVLLVDLNILPGGGIALLKKLRDPNFSPCPTVPVIMMANGATVQDVIAARDAGTTEFLTRPASLKGVERVLKAALKNERDFVVASSYRGPDRRRRKLDGLSKERRTRLLNQIETDGAVTTPVEAPKIVA